MEAKSRMNKPGVMDAHLPDRFVRRFAIHCYSRRHGERFLRPKYVEVAVADSNELPAPEEIFFGRDGSPVFVWVKSIFAGVQPKRNRVDLGIPLSSKCNCSVSFFVVDLRIDSQT